MLRCRRCHLWYSCCCLCPSCYIDMQLYTRNMLFHTCSNDCPPNSLNNSLIFLQLIYPS
ncbi:hypothetical protein BDF14DRAFT_1998273 [Spinellus fusiger]|nr:hypothetical protein BDF14DRAFT_1998273 [Spinellus fusiger]